MFLVLFLKFQGVFPPRKQEGKTVASEVRQDTGGVVPVLCTRVPCGPFLLQPRRRCQIEAAAEKELSAACQMYRTLFSHYYTYYYTYSHVMHSNMCGNVRTMHMLLLPAEEELNGVPHVQDIVLASY